MMQGIKYAIAFILGAVYSSAIWSLAVFGGNENVMLVIPVAVAALGSMGIVFSVFGWLMDNWDE